MSEKSDLWVFTLGGAAIGALAYVLTRAVNNKSRLHDDRDQVITLPVSLNTAEETVFTNKPFLIRVSIPSNNYVPDETLIELRLSAQGGKFDSDNKKLTVKVGGAPQYFKVIVPIQPSYPSNFYFYADGSLTVNRIDRSDTYLFTAYPVAAVVYPSND